MEIKKCTLCNSTDLRKTKNGTLGNTCKKCITDKIIKSRLKGKGWTSHSVKCSKERAEKIGKANKGNSPSKKSRKQMSNAQHARFAKQDKTARWYQQIGANETEILDKLESTNNIKLLRQHPVKVKSNSKFAFKTYRLDGYDKVNNVAYEIEDKRHFKAGGIEHEYHANRRKQIISVLNCKFIRVSNKLTQ